MVALFDEMLTSVELDSVHGVRRLAQRQWITSGCTSEETERDSRVNISRLISSLPCPRRCLSTCLVTCLLCPYKVSLANRSSVLSSDSSRFTDQNISSRLKLWPNWRPAIPETCSKRECFANINDMLNIQIRFMLLCGRRVAMLYTQRKAFVSSACGLIYMRSELCICEYRPSLNVDDIDNLVVLKRVSSWFPEQRAKTSLMKRNGKKLTSVKFERKNLKICLISSRHTIKAQHF